MGRFLAILNGAADKASKASLDEERQLEFMRAWAAWAQQHESALVDPGTPLNMKKRVTADSVAEFEDAKIAYAIVEAATHEDAVRIFASHPHLGLFAGNSIEVLECPVVPGQTSA